MSWHQVPKFHFLEHLSLQSRFQNPKWSWTYTDEDFMGIMKDVAEACTVATPWDQVVPKVCEKWRLGYGLRLRK